MAFQELLFKLFQVPQRQNELGMLRPFVYIVPYEQNTPCSGFKNSITTIKYLCIIWFPIWAFLLFMQRKERKTAFFMQNLLVWCHKVISVLFQLWECIYWMWGKMMSCSKLFMACSWSYLKAVPSNFFKIGFNVSHYTWSPQHQSK